MKLPEIKEIARSVGVKYVVGMKKADLIKAVQRAEGNFDCFGSPEAGYCDRADCAWREDCLPKG